MIVLSNSHVRLPRRTSPRRGRAFERRSANINRIAENKLVWGSYALPSRINVGKNSQGAIRPLNQRRASSTFLRLNPRLASSSGAFSWSHQLSPPRVEQDEV